MFRYRSQSESPLVVAVVLVGCWAVNPVPVAPADEDKPPELTYRELRGPVGPIRHLAFSPDGKLVAAGAGDSSVITVWDAATGNEQVRFQLPVSSYGFRVAFSADGRTLLSEGREDEKIRTWDVDREGKTPGRLGKQVREFKQPGEALKPKGFSSYFLAFSPDARRAAFFRLGTPYGIKVVETATGKTVSEVDTGEDSRGAAFSPDGKILAVHGLTGGLRLIDPAKGKVLRQLRDPNPRKGGAFAFTVFSPDGKSLATGGHIDDKLHVWDVGKGKESFQLTCGGFFTSASFSPNGILLATSSTDGIALYNLTREKEQRKLAPPDRLDYVVFAPDGQRLAVAGAKGNVYLYETPSTPAEKKDK
jgi:WD40 repeat protein